jgi:tetratricopeptide (TPR) repeat protein
MIKKNLQVNCLGILMMLLFVGLFVSGIVHAEEQLTAEELLTQCRDKYELADDLWHSKKYDEAKTLYKYVAQNSSDSDLTMKSKARGASCDIQLGNYSAAGQAIEALKKDYATHDGLCAELYSPADDYWFKDKFDEAKALGEYIARNSSDSDMVMTCRVWVAGCDIRLGNYSAAEQALEAVKNDYSQNNKLYPEFCRIAHEYWRMRKYDKAKALYLYITQNSSDTERRLEGRLRVAGCEILLGNDSTADQAFEKLTNDYSQDPRLCANIFQIGEEYYFRGEEAINNDNSEQARANFQRAIAIWRKNINKTTNSHHLSNACYFTAIAYQYLKEYQKAAKYFEEVVKGGPDYYRRWHALSSLAILYEEQWRMNKLSKEAATSKIKKIYQEIIQKYPDAPPADAANAWLQEN